MPHRLLTMPHSLLQRSRRWAHHPRDPLAFDAQPSFVLYDP